MWRSGALVLGILFPLAAQPAVAQPPVGSNVSQVTGGVVYHWERVPSSHKHELYVSGHRIGIYDPDTNVYLRVNADGTLSGPAPPPWKQPTEPVVKTEKTAPVEEPKEEKPAEDFFSRLPPWAGYAIGAAVTLLLTIIGIVMQLRRQ
jgi:hypothetical protein